MPAPRWKAVKIDEVEALAGPGTLSWRPLRHELGVQAFGVNAYTGNTVVSAEHRCERIRIGRSGRCARFPAVSD